MQKSPDWYPDPTRRHQLRYHDGARWTEHVSDNGATALDAVDKLDRFDAALTVDEGGGTDRVRRQVSEGGMAGAGLGEVTAGGGTLFTESVLVVNQQAKLIELAAQYGIFDAQGARLGSVNQTGQTMIKKLVRLVFDIDQFLTHRFEVADNEGKVVLRLSRGAKIFKSTIVVADGSGTEIGRIAQENMIGKIHFGLLAGGRKIGAIKAENWRAWNFRIEDETGEEVARITKTWEGMLKTMFTTADNYVVQIHRQLPEPLRSMVVASAVSIDTALKQDQRGLN